MVEPIGAARAASCTRASPETFGAATRAMAPAVWFARVASASTPPAWKIAPSPGPDAAAALPRTAKRASSALDASDRAMVTTADASRSVRGCARVRPVRPRRAIRRDPCSTAHAAAVFPRLPAPPVTAITASGSAAGRVGGTHAITFPTWFPPDISRMHSRTATRPLRWEHTGATVPSWSRRASDRNRAPSSPGDKKSNATSW